MSPLSAVFANALKAHIAAHPALTAVQIVAMVVGLSPSIVISPLFGLLGFGILGPMAGSLAAWYQSIHGATAIFSLLQSVPMMGYGVSCVNAIVQGMAFGSIALAEGLKRLLDLLQSGTE